MKNTYQFDYSVRTENTVTNDPSLSLKINSEYLGETFSGTPKVAVEIIGIEFTNQRGKRVTLGPSVLAIAMRVKDWVEVFTDIESLAKTEFEQRQHVKAAQELTNKITA